MVGSIARIFCWRGPCTTPVYDWMGDAERVHRGDVTADPGRTLAVYRSARLTIGHAVSASDSHAGNDRERADPYERVARGGFNRHRGPGGQHTNPHERCACGIRGTGFNAIH